MWRNALSKLQTPLRAGVARSLSVTATVQEKYINRVQLLGRVGRDPEQRGEMHPVVFFPLATTLTVRASAEDEDVSSDGRSERSITTWHAVTVGPASFRRYVQEFVTKGSRIIVDGSLSYYKSTTPDGTVKMTATVKAKDLIILSTPNRQEALDEATPTGSQYSDHEDPNFITVPESELR